MDSKKNEVQYADVDFDACGRVVKNIAARSAADPLAHYIVRKILRGERVSAEEQSYYRMVVPELVRSG